MQTRVEFFDNHHQQLVGILDAPEGARAGIILCHGLPSSKESSSSVKLQERLAKKGIASLRFDFYGCGESEGEPENITISIMVDDILAAQHFLSEQGFTKVGLLGSSSGGFAALVAASKMKDCICLALKSPVCEYFSLLKESLGAEGIRQWKNKTTSFVDGMFLKDTFLYDCQNYNGFEIAQGLMLPTLIVHGTGDRDVPIDPSRKFCSLHSNCALVEIEGADHRYSDPTDQETMLHTLTEWIFQTI